MDVAEWEPTFVEKTLGNPLILSNIFSFSSVTDLKGIRLVCKNWRDASVPEWKAKAKLRLLWRRDRCILCKCQDEALLMERTIEISEYVKSVKGKPFCRYKIVNFCILHPKRDEVDEEVEMFWRLYGREIKCLELDHVSFHNRKHNAGYDWLFTEVCTNLEELTLPLDRRPGCGHGEEFQDESMEVKSMLEKGLPKPIASIKVLHVKECFLARPYLVVPRYVLLMRSWEVHFFNSSFRLLAYLLNMTTFTFNANSRQWIKMLREYSSLKLPHSCLTSVIFRERYSEIVDYEENMHSWLTYFKQAPPLREITYDFRFEGRLYRDDRVGLPLKSILELCGSTLVRLSIRFYDESEDQPQKDIISSYLSNVDFPQLQSLFLYDQPFISFRFLRRMSSLHTLHIESEQKRLAELLPLKIDSIHFPSQISWNWNQKLLLEFQSMEAAEEKLELKSLRHLHINYDRFSPITIGLLCKYMPDLESLEVVTSTRTQPLINQLWPNLANLKHLPRLEAPTATDIRYERDCECKCLMCTRGYRCGPRDVLFRYRFRLCHELESITFQRND